jgi:hypothetical protein
MSKVEFLVDGSLFSSSTYAPYSAYWNTTSVANGNHTLAARATDVNGNIATSVVISVTVDNDLTAPTVSLTSPASGASVSGSVSIQVSATDNKSVSLVRLLVDGSVLATSYSAPYTFTWQTLSFSNGTHTLSAVAADPSGNVATSAPITVTVFNDTTAPTVAITSPANGTSVVGVVSLQALAADDVGVTGVDFFVNGALLGSVTTPPYSLDWNTDLEGNGGYILSARARDAAGNIRTSAQVVVSVSQPGRATFDSNLHVPSCATQGASCDTMNLVMSRGSTERNSPNTLDGCADGTIPVSSNDEKINRIKLSRVDGAVLEEGQPARIDVDVMVYSTDVDVLDVFYTGNAIHPSWTYLTTLWPTATGAQTLSTQFNLTSGSLQAVRAQFRKGGSTVACTSGIYAVHDERDDMAFAVKPSPDSAPPTVALTSPASNAQVAYTLSVTATASDDVVVTQVEFYDGTTLIGTSSVSPYAVPWNVTGLAEGAHTLTAKAYDGVGHVSTSAGVTVIVDNTAPATAVSAPAQSALVHGTVQVSATASDSQGVARVDFYAGATLIGTDSTAPYSASWDTTGWPNGSVTLTTRAYDIAGNVTLSAGRAVSVDNTAPTVALTSPANGASVFLTTTVSASASDNVGVSQVVFYDGASVIGTDTTSPYSISWGLLSVPKGNHTLTAKAYDAAGNLTTSTPITVKVN